MTAKIVEFVGEEQAMADLRRWADQLGPEVARAAAPFAQQIAQRVAGIVPVVSGTLAASVHAGEDLGGDANAATVTIGDGVPYAGWIEFGGGRGRPYIADGRYLYPTAQAAEDEYAAMAADAAADSVGRFSWS